MSTPATGLTDVDAAARLHRDGSNTLPSARPRGLLQLLRELLREPMFLLLVTCAVLYLLLGEPTDALVLSVAIAVVIGITLYQARKTERALAALRDLSSPRALVIRAGVRRRIAAAELVVGDWIVISEGDRVPADGVLRDTSQLQIDESLLTGESLAVSKQVATAVTAITSMARPGTDSNGFVYAGTLVTGGSGIAEVLATGIRTEMGRIGHALQRDMVRASPLQQESTRLVRLIARLALLLSVLVLLVHGVSSGQWLAGTLAGLSVAMALLPEEIPVVLTVFMALGAWRMSRQNVLTRRLAAIETLGAATVLCVDKTGTLTENRMTVVAVIDRHGHALTLDHGPLPEATHEVIEHALLATRRDPFDPMERAIQELGLADRLDAAHLHHDWQMEREYPLSPALLAMTQVWRSADRTQRLIAAKGAPEAIADLCHLDASSRAHWLHRVQALADQGWRVLAVARAITEHDGEATAGAPRALPNAAHAFAFEWLGLLALADPVRADVPAAVQACHDAGIRVVMITGDYPGTARRIAADAGLATGNSAVLTGQECAELNRAQLAERLRSVPVIARAIPEHKLHIVQALQDNGEVVAMTGDGVNDAPALRAADIGIAMGGRGTDVAREAADLVLTDDNFRSLVDAVRAGRRIFQNLQRAVAYIVSVHLPIAGLCLLPLLFGWPMLLLPAHIAFLELIIDPACTIAFEAERGEPAQMRSPPRPRQTPLLDHATFWRAMLDGVLVLLCTLILVAFAQRSLPEPAVRALAFSVLVLGNLALILVNRRRDSSLRTMLVKPTSALLAIIVGTLLALLAVLTVPLLQQVFRFAPPPPVWWAVVVVAIVLMWLLLSLLNHILERRRQQAVTTRQS